jgi:hypothetical protein
MLTSFPASILNLTRDRLGIPNDSISSQIALIKPTISFATERAQPGHRVRTLQTLTDDEGSNVFRGLARR